MQLVEGDLSHNKIEPTRFRQTCDDVLVLPFCDKKDVVLPIQPMNYITCIDAPLMGSSAK
jgi:hypothetical protein